MKKATFLTLSLLVTFLSSSFLSSQGYRAGDHAEDFSLKSTDEKMVSLKDFPNAAGFIVIFTCNHCPYAVKYEDRIIALDKKYKDKGYPVIAINPNNPALQPGDSFEKMKDRAKEKGFTFPYLFDEGQKVFPKFGATKTPHVFILQKEDHKLAVKYVGAIDNNYKDATAADKKYVEDVIDALLENKDLPYTETKAIGCGIKS